MQEIMEKISKISSNLSAQDRKTLIACIGSLVTKTKEAAQLLGATQMNLINSPNDNGLKQRVEDKQREIDYITNRLRIMRDS